MPLLCLTPSNCEGEGGQDILKKRETKYNTTMIQHIIIITKLLGGGPGSQFFITGPRIWGSQCPLPISYSTVYCPALYIFNNITECESLTQEKLSYLVKTYPLPVLSMPLCTNFIANTHLFFYFLLDRPRGRSEFS